MTWWLRCSQTHWRQRAWSSRPLRISTSQLVCFRGRPGEVTWGPSLLSCRPRRVLLLSRRYRCWWWGSSRRWRWLRIRGRRIRNWSLFIGIQLLSTRRSSGDRMCTRARLWRRKSSFTCSLIQPSMLASCGSSTSTRSTTGMRRRSWRRSLSWTRPRESPARRERERSEFDYKFVQLSVMSFASSFYVFKLSLIFPIPSCSASAAISLSLIYLSSSSSSPASTLLSSFG